MKPKHKLPKEDIISIIRLICLGIAGLGLSILFIFLYEKYNNLLLTICTAVFSLIYIVLIFGFLLFIEHKRIPDNPMRILDCFLWSVYTMPAFIVVMLIVVLIMVGMAYAG